MKSKWLWGIGIAIVVIVLGVGCSYLVYKNQDSSEETPKNKDYLYKIKYDDGGDPGNTYTLYFDKNYNIKVVHQPHCSAADCLDGSKELEEETFNVSFSNKAKTKLKKYIEEIFQDEDSQEIKVLGYDREDKKIQVISSIIYENEEALDLALETYDYKVSYNYGYMTTYTIFVEGESVRVRKDEYNQINTDVVTNSFDIKFSPENMKIVRDMVKEIETKDDYEKPYGNNLVVLQSLVNNDESILSKLSDKKMLFTLEFGGCTKAFIYDDGTYTLYGTTGRMQNTFQEGETSYDIKSFLDNYANYVTSRGSLVLKINGKTSYIDSGNIEVQELMTSVNLGPCLAVD